MSHPTGTSSERPAQNAPPSGLGPAHRRLVADRQPGPLGWVLRLLTRDEQVPQTTRDPGCST